MPVVALRWVLIRDPLGRFDSRPLLCTQEDPTPAFTLECFVRPWQVEVTFEEARAHLGLETQRQWSDKAIVRTTPCLLGSYSLWTLAAQELLPTGQFYWRCAAWYPKPQATFSDTIAGVRRSLWSHAYFSISLHEHDMVQIPRPLVDRFVDSLCYAD